MKKPNSILLMLFIVCLSTACSQAQSQTVTLTATNGQPSSFNCSSNQVITINSFNGINQVGGTATISYNNGLNTTISPNAYGLIRSSDPSAAFNNSAVFTGVTNILVSANNSVVALTFTVTTPTVQSYIPANAVVIPTDATGPVQIVLESSSDLINWTSSLPGTYGNTHSNRFFRVRAIAQ